MSRGWIWPNMAAKFWCLVPSAISLPVRGGLAKHYATALDQLISLIAPDRTLAQITGAPDSETQQVTQGIQPSALQRHRVTCNSPADCQRFNHAIKKCRQKEGKTKNPMAR